jgi:hypothetical protein
MTMDKVSFLNRLHFNASRVCKHTIGIGFDGPALRKRILADYASHGPGKKLEIPRIEYRNNEREIRDHYMAKSIPVIITGLATQWPCVSKWTPAFLREQYGDDPIVITEDTAKAKTTEGGPDDARLRDIIDSLERGDDSRYARFSDLLHRHPELIADIDWELLNRLKQPLSARYPEVYIFIGAKGTSTTLHSECLHNLFVQVYGTKRWYLACPNQDPAMRAVVNRSPYFLSPVDPQATAEKADPIIEYMDHYDFELHAGEILFNPSSYWHQVTNLTGSIGFGFRWVALDMFRINFTASLMALTATNPSVFSLKKENVSKFIKKYTEQNGGMFRHD